MSIKNPYFWGLCMWGKSSNFALAYIRTPRDSRPRRSMTPTFYATLSPLQLYELHRGPQND